MKTFKTTPVEDIETQEEARDIAIEWQHWVSEQNLSWGEFADFGDYFESLVKKFPELAEEFKENGII